MIFLNLRKKDISTIGTVCNLNNFENQQFGLLNARTKLLGLRKIIEILFRSSRVFHPKKY